MRLRRTSALVLTLAAFLLARTAAAQGTVTIVVPGAQTAAEGNSSNQFPFNPRSVGVSTIRYQQVYGSGNFAPGRYLISQIAFRPDGFPNAPFTGTIGNIRIDLSTTARAPDGLSTTFADNVGTDNTTVFSGELALSSANSGPAGGPFPFDIVINLTTPFLYDPAAGNLLMDVRNFGGGTLNVLNNTFVSFDAQSTTGDAVSRVFTGASFDGVNDPVGVLDTAGSLGLVTRFTAAFVESQRVDLMANGGQGPLTLLPGAPLRIEMAFNAPGPGLAAAKVAVGVRAPFGVLWLGPTGFGSTPALLYSGPLGDFGPVTLFDFTSTTGFPAGRYTWFALVQDSASGTVSSDTVDTVLP